MGFPDSLYRELFEQPPRLAITKARTHPLDYDTPEYVEARIALSLQMTLAAYRMLPKRERKTWYYYHVLFNKKEERSYDRAKEEGNSP